MQMEFSIVLPPQLASQSDKVGIIRESRSGPRHGPKSGFWPDAKKKNVGPPARAVKLKIFTQDLDQSATARPQAPFRSAGLDQLHWLPIPLLDPGPRF